MSIADGVLDVTAIAALGGRTYPANNKVGLIGDSSVYNNIWPSILEAQANQSVRYMAHGFMTWAMFLSRQRFTCERTEAYGKYGDDTFDLVGGDSGNGTVRPNRLATALVANDAATWIVRAGSNDIVANYPVAAIIANLTTAIQTILDAGRAVVLLLPSPRTAPNGLTSPQQLAQSAIRRWAKGLRGTERLHVVDTWEYRNDPTVATGAPKAGHTYDGLHSTQLGAYWDGYALAKFFGIGREEGYFPYFDVMTRTNIDLYDAATNPRGNLIPNPQLLGTGGTPGGDGVNGTGVVADGWAGQNGGTGLVRAYSKVVCADGYPAQQIRYQGVATAAGDSWALIKNPITASQLAIGDTVEGFADVEVDAGGVGLPSYGVAFMNAALNRIMWGDYVAGTTEAFDMPNVKLEGVMKTPRWTIPDTTMRFGIVVRIANGRTIDTTIRVRGIEARKVIA